MPPRLSLFLWNARGFGAYRGKKFASFLLWAQTSMHQVFVLTETHLPGDPLLWLGHQPGAAGGFRWKGSYFWTPGFSHSKGVLVLFKGGLRIPITQRLDPFGRFPLAPEVP